MLRLRKDNRSPDKLRAEIARSLRKGNLRDTLRRFGLMIGEDQSKGNHREAADLGLTVGHALFAAQRWDEAIPFLEGAVEDNYRVGHESRPDGVLRTPLWEMREVAECRYWLGCSQARAGQHPSAIANLRRAAVALEAMHEEKQAGDAFLMWGAALRDYGLDTGRERLLHMALAKFKSATELYAQAEAWREGEAGAGPGQCFLSSAPACFALGMYDEVLAAYPAAKAVFDRYGDRHQRRWALETYEKALALKRGAIVP